MLYQIYLTQKEINAWAVKKCAAQMPAVIFRIFCFFLYKNKRFKGKKPSKNPHFAEVSSWWKVPLDKAGHIDPVITMNLYNFHVFGEQQSATGRCQVFVPVSLQSLISVCRSLA